MTQGGRSVERRSGCRWRSLSNHRPPLRASSGVANHRFQLLLERSTGWHGKRARVVLHYFVSARSVNPELGAIKPMPRPLDQSRGTGVAEHGGRSNDQSLQEGAVREKVCSAAFNRAELAGRFSAGFHAGEQSGWTVHARQGSTAVAVVSLLGGRFGATGTEAVTERDDVGVVLDREDVALRMVLTRGRYGAGDGRLLPQPHPADGPQCACLRFWRGRKEAARTGGGPFPECTVTFRLLGAPALGYFTMTSSSWDFAVSIPHVQAELASDGRRSQVCRLRLVREERTTRSGQVVTYRRPELLVNAK